MADSYDDYFKSQQAPAPASVASPPDPTGPQVIDPGGVPASAPPITAAAAPAASYDDFFKSYQSAQRSQAQSSFYLAKDTDPDHAGQVVNAATQAGVDPDFVDRNFDVLKHDQYFSAINVPKLARQNPAVMTLASNPFKAAVIKDDIPNLCKMEDRVVEHNGLQQVGDIIAAATLDFAAGITKIPAVDYDILNYPGNLYRRLTGDPRRVTSDDTPFTRNNSVTLYLESQAKAFREKATILNEGTIDAFTKPVHSSTYASVPERVMDLLSQGDYTRGAEVLLAHGASQAPVLIALFGGAAAGVGPLAAAVLGAQTGADKNAQNLEEKVDPAAGIPNAAAHAAIVSLLDRTGAYEYFGAIGSRLTQKFGPEISAEVMKSYGATIGKLALAEGGKMATMSAAGDFADFATGIDKVSFAESVRRAAEAGMLGGLVGTATTAPVEGYVRLHEMRRAQAAKTLVDNLVEDSQGKTRDRSPELHQELIKKTVAGTPYEEAQISPDALETFYQSKGKDPVKAMQDLGFLDQFAHAKETGTNIIIPTEKLIDGIARTGDKDLSQHVTFKEGNASVADLEARQRAEEQVAQANKDSLDQAESVALNERGLTPEQQAEESGEQVKRHIADELEKAGQDRRHADLIARSIKTMAQRSGLDPLELYRRYGLQFAGPGAELNIPDNSVKLNQAAIDTAEISAAKEVLNRIDTPEKAQALSGEERAEYHAALDTIYGVREKRARDLGFADDKWFHGTHREGIKSFRRSNENEELGGGVYLASDQSDSRGFGPNQHEVRVRGAAGQFDGYDPAMDEALARRGWTDDEIAAWRDGGHLNKHNIFGGADEEQMARFARAQEDLQAEGFTGLDSQFTSGAQRNVFDPKDIRSIDAAFDPRFKDSPLILAQSDAFKKGFTPAADTFYSKLTRTVEEKMPNTAPPDQVRGILKDMKPEEKKWLQVEEFLKDKKKISKVELLQFLRANNPKIVDVTKGYGADADQTPALEVSSIERKGNDWHLKYSDGTTQDFDVREGDTPEEITQMALEMRAQDRSRPRPDSDPKYPTYTLPGGENYREVLFTLPDADERLREAKRAAKEEYLAAEKKVHDATARIIKEGGHWSEARGLAVEEGYITAEDSDRALELREKYMDISSERGQNFTSSHWNEANILAFVRANDRVDAEGKRVLHLEEVQSDWHQTGRKRGYLDDLAKLEAERKTLAREMDAATEDTPRTKEISTRLKAIHEEITKIGNGGAVPDAPFRKTWHEFALKKAIRMAAEGGYDKISWTTGEQQADRYKLSNHIDRIQYSKSKREPGKYNVIAYNKNGDSHAGMLYSQSPEQIEALFGKDVTKRIVEDQGVDANDGTKEKALSGLQLSVGGEGMKGFYDKIIPDYLRKFGKKYGTTVGETLLSETARSRYEVKEDTDYGSFYVSDPANPDYESTSHDTREEAEAELAELNANLAPDGSELRVHSMEITPQLRDAALNQGFELFQGGENTPRGQISIGPTSIIIQTFEGADPSTIIHEQGHFIVEMMKRLSADNAGIKEDFDALMKHVGNDGGEITREQHEEIARTFEGYVMEGKAPSKALAKTFYRMKTWLIDVYKHMTALNINMTDEVRGVFDRVLATDEEIAEVRGNQNMGSLFTGKARELLTAEQYAKVGFAVDAAKQSADDHLRAEVMRDITKEQTEAWEKGLDVEREKARAAAEEMPVYKATAMLQRGETPAGEKLAPDLQKIKLSRKALVDMYGKEVLEKLPRPLVYAKEGLHPDAVADMLGYESGRDMVDDMIKSPKMIDHIEETANAAMQAKDPDLYKSPRMPEEALKAIHNDEQAKVTRLEMDYLREMSPGAERDLTRMIAKRPASDRVLKETVRNEIGRMNLKDVRPNIYRVAERQAAAEAGKRLAAGDIDGAYDAKRKELLNHELYRAATEAQDYVKDAMKVFKKVNRSDEDLAKTRDTNLVNTIRAILAANGIGKDKYPPSYYLEKMRSYDPDAYEAAAYHVANVTKQASINYKENTMGAFAEMTESVKALWEMAGDQRKLELNGQKLRRQQIVDDLVAQAGNTGDLSAVKPGTKRAITTAENIKLNLMSWRAALTRVEHWVHGKDLSDFGGVFREYIWKPVADATSTKTIKYAEVMRGYKAHVEANKEIFTTKPIEAPELDYTFKNKKELLGALMHTGNESNMSKLLRGRAWGSVNEDGTLNRTQWDTFINRMHQEGVLGKKDYDFVQGVWDMYESLKPDAQRAHKKLFGFHFNEVTADAFETPFGEYKGGYAPAVADPTIVNDAAMRREAEAFGNHGNMMLMPTGGRGFTKNRNEQYAAPLALDLDYVPMAVDKVLRFTYVESVVRDVAKIVYDRKFAEAINTVDPGAHEMLVSWLNRAAKQQAGVPSGQGRGWRALDGFFRAVRTRTGLGAMAGNIVNAGHQLTGFPVATSLTGVNNMRDALISYVKDSRGVTESIMEKSAFMRAHHLDPQGLQGDIEDLMVNPGKIKTAEEWSKKNSYFLQRYTAGLTEAVAWTAGYSRATSEGMTEERAIDFADSVVTRTQHAMRPIDIGAYETGSPLYKMFTQFTGYYNNKANLLGSKAMASIRETGIKKAAVPLIGLYASVMMVPSIMAKSLYMAASGKIDQNDDGHYVDDLWHLFFGAQVDEALALVPFVGPTINYAIRTGTSDRPADERYVVSPAFNMIQTLGMTYPDTRDALKGRGKPSKAIKDWMTLIGLMSGLPTQPLAKPLGYAADVQSGKVKSRGPIDYTRGLLTGTGPRH